MAITEFAKLDGKVTEGPNSETQKVKESMLKIN